MTFPEAIDITSVLYFPSSHVYRAPVSQIAVYIGTASYCYTNKTNRVREMSDVNLSCGADMHDSLILDS